MQVDRQAEPINLEEEHLSRVWGKERQGKATGRMEFLVSFLRCRLIRRDTNCNLVNINIVNSLIYS